MKPTTVDGLATVTLQETAEQALRLQVSPVESVPSRMSLTTGAEVMVPAGRDVVLASPVSGRVAGPRELPRPGDRVVAGQLLLSLTPIASVDRDVRARSQRELDVARSDLELAESRVKRAQTMVADQSGSARSFEDARAQQQVAKASVDAAEARLKTLQGGSLDSDLSLSVRSPADGVVRAVRVTSGQSVPQGAALIEITSSGRWVRAAFPAGDAERLSSVESASARRASGTEAVPVTATQGPLSADALRGTIDRYFVLPPEAEWVPGERVIVEVVTSQDGPGALAVPWASVVRDAEGGAWVYERIAPLSYRRRRVEPLRRDGDRMLLARGPKVGTPVVTAGAAELWGFELGADK